MCSNSSIGFNALNTACEGQRGRKRRGKGVLDASASLIARRRVSDAPCVYTCHEQHRYRRSGAFPPRRPPQLRRKRAVPALRVHSPSTDSAILFIRAAAYHRAGGRLVTCETARASDPFAETEPRLISSLSFLPLTLLPLSFPLFLFHLSLYSPVDYTRTSRCVSSSRSLVLIQPPDFSSSSSPSRMRFTTLLALSSTLLLSSLSPSLAHFDYGGGARPQEGAAPAPPPAAAHAQPAGGQHRRHHSKVASAVLSGLSSGESPTLRRGAKRAGAPSPSSKEEEEEGTQPAHPTSAPSQTPPYGGEFVTTAQPPIVGNTTAVESPSSSSSATSSSASSTATARRLPANPAYHDPVPIGDDTATHGAHLKRATQKTGWSLKGLKKGGVAFGFLPDDGALHPLLPSSPPSLHGKDARLTLFSPHPLPPRLLILPFLPPLVLQAPAAVSPKPSR